MGNSTLTTLRTKCQAVVLTALLLSMPLGVGAAGLGKISVLSALGQPLRAEVDVTASREELASLSARVASAEAFKQAGIEYSSVLANIRMTVDKRTDGAPYLSLVSDRPFNEPFLDMLVELNWNSGRLVREYTFLLDPPDLVQKPAAALLAPVSPPLTAPVAPPPGPVAVAAPAAQAPAVAPIDARDVPPPQQAPQPRPEDMKVMRGADGVQRIVKADSVEAENAQRLVKRGDTLGQIARDTKPEGVNLDQMLVALFRRNQDAFEGNVNRLKAGKILSIPDREAAAGVDAQEAKKTVLAHAADFNAYTKKLASSVAAATSQKDETPKRVATGKIAPKVEDKLPSAAPGKDKLEVSKSELAAGAAGKAGAGRLAAIEETLIAREKALKDANSRIAELEKNLNDLKKLIDLKNQGMAELQKQAQVAKSPAAARPPPPEDVKKSVVAAETPAAKPALTPPEKVVEKPADKPVEAAKQAAPKKSAAAAAPPPATPPAQAESGFMEQSPEVAYGGGGILALLLFYFGYKKFKQRQGPGRADPSEPSSAGARGATGASTVDGNGLLGQSEFSNVSGAAGADGDAGVDPVAEADVYLAYGRDVQAEEILLDALKTDPARHAIHLKLLEIYANRKSPKQFETIAKDLHTQTGGSGPAWEKAANLGRQVDPANPLYGPAQAAGKAFDPDATLVIAPAEQDMDFANLDAVAPAGQDLLESVDAAPAAKEMDAQPAEELPASLDFELDLAEPTPVPDVPLAADTATSVPQESTGLDMDLGLDAEKSTAADSLLETPAAEQAPQLATPSVTDFDLDLEIGPKEAAASELTAEVPVEAEPSGNADAGLDFNFDLEIAEPAAPAPAPEPAAAGSSIDFALEVPAVKAPQPAAPSVDLSSINLDLDSPLEPAMPPSPPKAPEVDDPASQDVETKLELAQAYEEMGDKEGARELLQEVLNEGNAAQKETARSKLERLD